MARKTRNLKKSEIRSKKEDDENYVDDGRAPVIYTDGFKSVMHNNGVVKLNLFSIIVNVETNETVKQVVARLSMPLPVMLSFYDTLGVVIEKMKADGIIEEITSQGSLEE